MKRTTPDRVGVLRRLTDKPWLSQGDDPYRDDASGVLPAPAAAVGLRVYFCVATVMFGLLLVGWAMRTGSGVIGMGHEPDLSRPLPRSLLLWWNSGILVLSSIAWQYADLAARQMRIEMLRTSLLMGGALAAIFLIGQVAAWQDFQAAGYLLTNNPAVGFFFLIVVLHGLHLLGGLYVWARAMLQAMRAQEASTIGQTVKLCAVYWHYLLVVWLVMFALLLSS